MAAQATSTSQYFSDPAPTVSLDSLTNDGEYTPVQKDQLDLASMVDCAYSMADWSPSPVGSGSAAYATPHSTRDQYRSLEVEQTDSAAADLAALDSMYSALSSFGFQQEQPFRGLMQTDSMIGSVHASPASADPEGKIHGTQSAMNPHFVDNVGGHPASVPVLQNGQHYDVTSNKSMAAARSALIEMQNQGLSYQNIEELVHNIQNLLKSCRDKPSPTSVANQVNQANMDEGLRQAILQMVQTGNPQTAQDASALLAAASQYASMPSGTPDGCQPPAHQFQPPPYSPLAAHSPAHAFAPDTGPFSNMQNFAMLDANNPGLQSIPTHRHSHTSGQDESMLYQTFSSAHSRPMNPCPPDLSPPPTPHVPYSGRSLTPPSAHSHSSQTPRVQHTQSSRRLSMPAPKTPTTPTDPDALSPRRPPLKLTLQAKQDSQVGSEPLIGSARSSSGTGVFIPGLHKQPVSNLNGPGSSAPVIWGGSSRRSLGGAASGPGHLSAPLSDLQHVSCADPSLMSRGSLSGSTELPQVRASLSDDASWKRAEGMDRHVRGPNPVAPNYQQRGVEQGMSTCLRDLDPPAYSSSFFTQELLDEEESHDLSGSSSFHIHAHAYGSGEVMHPVLSNGAVPPRPLDPPGEDFSLSTPVAAHRIWRGSTKNNGGTSAPTLEPAGPSLEHGDRQSLSATFSHSSNSLDPFRQVSMKPGSSSVLPKVESLADALSHLSLPAEHVPAIGTLSGSSTQQTQHLSGSFYRRTMSDHGPCGASGSSLASCRSVPAPGTPTPTRNPTVQHSYLPMAARLDPRAVQKHASDCIPLAVTRWSQDHASVVIFLQLEQFNPASLMVQIQQHTVVVMALNSDAPSYVFNMRPEQAVRVQGSKSFPHPGSGIQITLQKRTPGSMWSSYGTVIAPPS